MLLKKQPRKIRLKKIRKDVPPLYTPHPDSLLPHRRCCRVACRAIVPEGIKSCLVCGSLIHSTEPLVKFTIYIEEF